MRRLALLVALATVSGCKCGTVQRIKPSIDVQPPQLSFGPVKNGDSTSRALKLTAQNTADVTISALALESGGAPGGKEGFTVKLDPITVSGSSTQNLAVTFHPTVLQAYQATLTLTTDDPDHGTVKIPISGQGAKPKMVVTPECSAMQGCTRAVVVDPPSIAFGPEPYVRPMPEPASQLPSVNITNDGDVELVISRLEITGADAAAFKIEGGNPTVPLTYDSMAGVNVPIRFKPLNETQMSYAADLVIESDDPDKASVTVHLTGSLSPNGAPVVCANLTQVTPANGCAPRDYRPEWPNLITVPMGGYDFRSSRAIEPGATVDFSALSSTDVTKCTSDPEDGRTNLTWSWSVIVKPAGSPALPTGNGPTFQLTPTAVGDYELLLTVSDQQGHMSSVHLKFTVARHEDLIVRLEWPGFASTDLDVHLVRPSSTQPGQPFSGAYSYFNEGANGHTSGDMNGYARRRAAANGTLDFEWGGIGSCDDPRLNLDDIGDGQLIEDVSLNNPERDARCDGGRCAYKVFVHYFRDYRMASGSACFADGGPDCSDGEQCACATGSKCVASPPSDGGRPLGAGECRAAPKPSVKVYLRGDSTPAATIPVPPDEVLLGAPCTMLYVADVNWPSQQESGSLPDGGTPPATITSRLDAGFARFGKRLPGDLRQCSPDDALNMWYSQQP